LWWSRCKQHCSPGERAGGTLGELRRPAPASDRAGLAIDGDRQPQQRHGQRPDEDSQVRPQRRAFDVEPVKPAFLGLQALEIVPHGIGVGEDPPLVREGELREARQPGTDRQDHVVVVSACRDEHRVLRPRADQAHLAAQDMPELRQLVESRAGEEAPHVREPTVRIGGQRESRRADRHLAELEHPQRDAPATDALGGVQDRARRLDHDGESDQ
jgi:hypothetical protein